MHQWLKWFATLPREKQFRLAAEVIADIRAILIK